MRTTSKSTHYIHRLISYALLLALVQLLEAQTIFNAAPSRIVGQAVLQQQGVLTATAPNLVEGREFNNPQAVAIDATANPPILYVADFGNNRVLAWKNASAFTKGDFADKVIGQRDFLSTGSEGPRADLSAGLSSPDAVAVDSAGNLYVADTGNNRILRYPRPFAQSSDVPAVDLVIGQPDLSSFLPNQGMPGATATGLAFARTGSVFRAGLALDAQGNLWASDPGNNRVLRFPVSELGAGSANQPPADLVLGQNDFSSTTLPSNLTRNGKNYLSQPSGLAFDPAGRLFIADSANRVVVYAPPFAIGESIERIIGVVTTANAPAVNESIFDTAQSVFFVGNDPYVVDTGNSRILEYDPFDQWPPETTLFSPRAKSVIGQPNFQSGLSNEGLPQPNASTLAGPVSAAFDGTDLMVVDAGNNRVLAFPRQGNGSFIAASRVLGQLDFQYTALNSIDGRELGFSGNVGSCGVNGALPFFLGGSVAIDAPRLYVTDPLNNRILGYLDYRKVNAGMKADLVIGQPDLLTSLVNYPSNSPTQASAQGLWSPEGLAVDSKGNLYVADACNGRVVRFPAPFEQTPGVMAHADLALGQASLFGQPVKDAGRQTMKSAYGLAFTAAGDLLVSDPLANRILYFKKTATGDFQTGQPAANVFGQPNFSSTIAAVFVSPHLIATDANDQLYVADTGNDRIAALPSVPTAGDNPPVLFAIPQLSSPYGVAVNQATGEIWALNTRGNQVLRYANSAAIITNAAASATLGVFGPIALALDPFGSPIVAEGGTNRVAFYYPAIDYTTSAGGVPGRSSGNAANFFGRFAPGMLASIFSFPSTPFGSQTASSSSIPISTLLGDMRVMVGGTPAPLMLVSPGQINFQVPGATPVGLAQEIQVAQVSTSHVLASWLFRIDAASPGLFTVDGSGSGQVAAVNEDGSLNNGAHPAKAGSVVTLYATGQGLVDNMPADGHPAQGIIETSGTPQVFINSDFVPASDVLYSGLAPGFEGLWQINVKVPGNVPPGDVIVFVEYGGINSILDPNGIRRTTTIRTTP